MDSEDVENNDNDQEDPGAGDLALAEIEEEFDIHVPVIGDNDVIEQDILRVPNGFHISDDEALSDSEDDLNDEEVPLQPRMGIGGLLGVLGQHYQVDESSDDDDDDDDDPEPETREEFDSELPGRHQYLGEGRELGGRTILEEGDVLSLPLLNQPGLALVPGQLLPLHLFHPSVISMMRTVIRATKTFGVVSLKADSRDWRGLVGTTAEIFEYNDSDEGTGVMRSGDAENEEEEELRIGADIGLKIKARGRQRFRLQSTRRQVDGNLIGEVKLLTDRELEEPDLDIRVPGLERFTRTFPEEECDVSSSEEQVPQKSSRSSFFSFLSMLRQSSPSSRVIPYTGVSSSLPLKSPRRRALRSHVMSPHPPWVWSLYSPSCLVSRVRAELSKLSSLSPNLASVPSDPTQLSWWATANLPLEDEVRSLLLSLNSPVQRLRVILSFLSQCRVLVCRSCGKQLGDQHHIFPMSKAVLSRIIGTLRLFKE